jgi:hypothetical protein
VQEEILRSIQTNRKTAVKACHSSSKTFTAAIATLHWLARYEDGVVITSAPSQTQVQKLLWGEIHTLRGKSLYPFPEPLLTELKFNTHRYALGFATNVTTQSEGTRFQGFHSRSGTILVIFDESVGIPPAIWEAALGSLSSNNARLLVLGNPTINSGNFYNCFHSDRESYNCITITAFESPNLQGLTLQSLLALSEEELDTNPRPYLVSRRWVKELYEELGEEHPLYQARVLGEFPNQSESALLDLAWLEAARERKLCTPNAPVIGGLDCAGPGEAESVLTLRKGPEIILQKAWAQSDPRGEVVATLQRYQDAGVLQAVNVDSIGIGWGMFCHLRDLGFAAVPINVGEAARDREKFANLKAELYWALRLRAEAGDLSGELDERTVGQLAGIRYQHNPRGQIQIESKDDARKRGVKSPDRAESVMLAFAQVGSGGGIYAHALATSDDNNSLIYDPVALRAREPGYSNAGWYESRAIVCAYGIALPMAFLEIEDRGSGKPIYITREFYYDNSRESCPLTEVEFLQRLMAFQHGRDPLTGVQHVRSCENDAQVYLPDTDECEHFRSECWLKGLPTTPVCMDSDELIADIQRVSNLLDRKILRISGECRNTVDQLRGFRFDVRKAFQRGVEAPVEDGRSQCCVAIRMYCKKLNFWRLVS